MSPANQTMASIETVPGQLRESLRQANIDNLLEYLSTKELRLGKNEQRGEPDLTTHEKVDILRIKYDTNPMKFLATFGRFLQPSHLDCFSSMRKDSYEINFYLTQLEISLSPEGKRKIAKNRRYEALQKLVDTTDYFTEEEMQRRNPILYEQLIGKYHSEEEREAFLFQSATTSSAVGSKSDSSYNSNARPTPLTDMLIAHMSRVDGECSERRIEQELQINEETVADEEYSLGDDTSVNMEMGEGHESRANQKNNDDRDVEEVDDDEKELLKEEFFTTMYRHFLEGKDEEIDYSTIDDNAEYDCGETFEQDEEEKYFDTDDTTEETKDNCEQNVPSLHGDCERVNDSWCQEANGSDTFYDSKMQLESDELVLGRDQNQNDDSEEDELDAYMKTIEMELNK